MNEVSREGFTFVVVCFFVLFSFQWELGHTCTAKRRGQQRAGEVEEIEGLGN